MPQVERIEIGGVWADVHTRPSHGQVKDFYRRFRGKKPEELPDTMDDIILILVERWSITDAKPTREAIDEAPEDVVLALAGKLSGYMNKDQTLSERLLAVSELLDENDPFKPRIEALAAEATTGNR